MHFAIGNIPILELAKLAISAFTLVSVVLAFLTYRANVKRQSEDRQRDVDNELLAQAQKSLEWAYNVLTAGGSVIPPKSDRLNWLTAARHILRQREISSNIVGETYKTVYRETEEYWRHRFYLALNDKSLLSPDYFLICDNPDWPQSIEVNSALVVTEFAGWNEETPDPINDVDRDAILNRGRYTQTFAGRGLASRMTKSDGGRPC